MPRGPTAIACGVLGAGFSLARNWLEPRTGHYRFALPTRLISAARALAANDLLHLAELRTPLTSLVAIALYHSPARVLREVFLVVNYSKGFGASTTYVSNKRANRTSTTSKAPLSCSYSALGIPARSLFAIPTFLGGISSISSVSRIPAGTALGSPPWFRFGHHFHKHCALVDQREESVPEISAHTLAHHSRVGSAPLSRLRFPEAHDAAARLSSRYVPTRRARKVGKYAREKEKKKVKKKRSGTAVNSYLNGSAAEPSESRDLAQPSKP